MPNIRTVADMAQTIACNLHLLDRAAYDCVVAIPRSGVLPASIIATSLQLPLATLEGYCAGIVHGRSGRSERAGRRILLVDDSCNKGGAMRRAMAMLPKGTEATRFAVYGPYQLDDPHSACDLWLEIVRGPRVFSWNMWKHIRLDRWAFDMDGVLCRDPAKAENDDGPAYLKFIAEAEPLFLPQRPIGHIVTSRLERYRQPTADWLARHGITYASLTMLDLPDKRARMTAMKVEGGRGGWKGREAARLGVEMMIESCPKQSSIIARTAGITVFCTQTQEVFDAARP